MTPSLSTPLFIPYHQFLTRPINNSIPGSFKKLSPTMPPEYIRDIFTIKPPEVEESDFNNLWSIISESLDSDHDIRSDSDKTFVLAICGDLRGRSPRNQSWSYETLLKLLEMYPTSAEQCFCKPESLGSMANMGCGRFTCRISTKAITMSSSEGSDAWEIPDLSDFPLVLSSLSNTLTRRPIQLHISTLSLSQLVILLLPQQLISDTETYPLPIATQLFLNWEHLPSSSKIGGNNFAVIGVLGVDYLESLRLRKCMQTFASLSSPRQSGYPTLFGILEEFAKKSKEIAFVKPQLRIKSESGPRVPPVPQVKVKRSAGVTAAKASGNTNLVQKPRLTSRALANSHRHFISQSSSASKAPDRLHANSSQHTQSNKLPEAGEPERISEHGQVKLASVIEVPKEETTSSVIEPSLSAPVQRLMPNACRTVSYKAIEAPAQAIRPGGLIDEPKSMRNCIDSTFEVPAEEKSKRALVSTPKTRRTGPKTSRPVTTSNNPSIRVSVQTSPSRNNDLSFAHSLMGKRSPPTARPMRSIQSRIPLSRHRIQTKQGSTSMRTGPTTSRPVTTTSNKPSVQVSVQTSPSRNNDLSLAHRLPTVMGKRSPPTTRPMRSIQSRIPLSRHRIQTKQGSTSISSGVPSPSIGKTVPLSSVTSSHIHLDLETPEKTLRMAELLSPIHASPASGSSEDSSRTSGTFPRLASVETTISLPTTTDLATFTFEMDPPQAYPLTFSRPLSPAISASSASSASVKPVEFPTTNLSTIRALISGPTHLSPSSSGFPFGLTRETESTPVTEVSLKSLTARLLLARQNSRLSDFNRLWAIEPSTSEPQCFFARFDGRLIHGLTLVEFPSESNVSSTYKICVYGCTKKGKHQHLSNVIYQRSHQSPPTKRTAKCPNFPDALRAPRPEDFLEPRNLLELGGLRLYFKTTNMQTGHLTALGALGATLLYYAVDHLQINEMTCWKDFEQGCSKDIGL